MGMFLRRGPAPHRTRMSDLEIEHIIKLSLNGTPLDWMVVHQGLPGSMYDESCDGTWLLIKDCYEKRTWNTSGGIGNTNSYGDSAIHLYLNSDFLDLFDIKIRNAIKQVKIPYRAGGGNYGDNTGTDQSGENGLPTKAFLLSACEAGSPATGSVPEEGSKLDYFITGSDGNEKRIANYNGSPTTWWTRSPYKGNGGSVWYYRTSGSIDYVTAGNSYGIRPAIILPSDMLVTDDMLA